MAGFPWPVFPLLGSRVLPWSLRNDAENLKHSVDPPSPDTPDDADPKTTVSQEGRHHHSLDYLAVDDPQRLSLGELSRGALRCPSFR